ncbi:endoglucanase [Caldicoprobacter guelmensis]|uniref:M42 family metallopeptidase n=1 Tax=Caldicoprobacter guelmensis TaxID=1170224 RepID=UPI00195CE918|nr:M42 family metallopeptidase [Caldicoprobacter guelmensis]MBM7582274.1 endoglucanase [Caldicoprobacter guelmensis]
MKELLKKLTEAYGPSGNEEIIRDVIRHEIEGFVDEVRVDTLGNLIAVRRGSGKKVMLAAHMDQIGFMVTHIDDNGFLRFTRVGGVSIRDSIRRRVIFKNGVTGVVSYEEEIEDIKDIKFEKMYIDIGAFSREQAESMVSIGDVAVYHSAFSENCGRYIGKAMDNRAGCALLIETAKRLKASPHEIYFVFTVQEELGVRGAKTAAYALNPDIGIAVDVTLTGDTPKSRPMAVKLGGGPAIKVKDVLVLAHPKVKSLMVNRAREADIPYQMEILEAGGTDAGAIHLTRGGIPSGVLSIPCRHVHSDSEMVDANDLENGVKLMTHILEGEIEI